MLFIGTVPMIMSRQMARIPFAWISVAPMRSTHFMSISVQQDGVYAHRRGTKHGVSPTIPAFEQRIGGQASASPIDSAGLPTSPSSGDGSCIQPENNTS